MITADALMRVTLASRKQRDGRDAPTVTKRDASQPVTRDIARDARVTQLALDIEAASRLREAEEAEVVAPAPLPRPPRGPQVDFHAVPPQQYDIDARLRNWGTWCNGTPVESSSPMFRLAQSSARARGEERSNSNGVDRSDAVRIAVGVTALPANHAAALNWCYVKPVSPGKACRSIGTTMQGLAALLNEGRQMLINRGF